MTFIQALFLLGAAGVAGPIAAHLLARPRYKRVPFTMLHLLRTGEVESQSRRKIRNVLVLLLRCIIIMLIALFFAGPERIVAVAQPDQPPRVFIGIDDSLSMAYEDIFSRALAEAKSAMNAADDAAVFHVAGLASGSAVRGVDRDQAVAFLNSLKPVALPAAPQSFLSQIRAASHEGGGPVHAVVISDFTPRMMAALADETDPIPVQASAYRQISPEDPARNVTIRSVEFAMAGAGNLVANVMLFNDSTEVVKGTLSLHFGERVGNSADLEMAPGHRQTVSLPLAIEGNLDGVPITVDLSCEDGLAADNAYYAGLSLSGPRSRNIVVFAADEREGFLLKTAVATLANTSTFEALTVQVMRHAMLSPQALAGADVVILASAPDQRNLGVRELSDFVRNGGRLIAFTNENLAPAFYESLAEEGVLPASPRDFNAGSLRLAGLPANPVYGDVLNSDGETIRALRNYRVSDFPVRGAYTMSPEDESHILWSFESGVGFVYYRSAEKGTGVLVNTSADGALSPIMKSPAAVAFVQYLIGPTSRLETLAFDAGENVQLPVGGKAGVRAIAPSGTLINAVASNGVLNIGPQSELGLIKTDGEPPVFGGINVPEGETVLTSPQETVLAATMDRLFPEADQIHGEVAANTDRERNSYWQVLAWISLALIVVDIFVSNRMNR